VYVFTFVERGSLNPLVQSVEFHSSSGHFGVIRMIWWDGCISGLVNLILKRIKCLWMCVY